MSEVKSSRPYDSSRRREQAGRTRQAILAAARSELLQHGYAATTVAEIAAAADTSVETVYKAFGGKAGLVRALWERGLAGTGPIPASERSDRVTATANNPVAVLRAWAGFTTEIAPELAPLMILVRAAATTAPDMAEFLRDLDDQRRERMLENARRLRRRGWLRAGLTTRAAADVLWCYSSSEMYELLVLKSGWSLPRYGDFVAEAMIAALLPC